MPKLPSLDPKNIINILKRNGFVLDRTKGSHHIYYHPESKRRVIIPFHNPLTRTILKEIDITKEDYQEIIKKL